MREYLDIMGWCYLDRVMVKNIISREKIKFWWFGIRYKEFEIFKEVFLVIIV